MNSPLKVLSLRNHDQKSTDDILQDVLLAVSEKKPTVLHHIVEHAGFGAILSRLMTGLNRALELKANYAFMINSSYTIDSLFDLSFQTELDNRPADHDIIHWNFLKDTWDAGTETRANHQFPRCPIDRKGLPLSRHQWCAILAKTICGKPLPALQAVIEETKNRLNWDAHDHIIGIHVRRGDKNTEAPYIETKTYIEFLKGVLAQNPQKKFAVFLASDDPNSYEVFKAELDTLAIPLLWDLHEERFNNYNASMVEQNHNLALQESITAGKNISLLGDCDYVIGMANAQFTWLGGLLCAFHHQLDSTRHIMIDARTNRQSHWASFYRFRADRLIPSLIKPNTLKILHISPNESGGGAAKAAYRIHQALQQNGTKSRMLVIRKQTQDPSVQSLRQSIWGFLKYKLYKKLHRFKQKSAVSFKTANSTLHSFGENGFELTNFINRSDADIVHLHWINGMLSIDDIANIRKPIVWTLLDMWPICGAEHYVPDDKPESRFRAGYLDHNRPSYESGPDLNKETWEAKKQAWQNKNFSIVGCSSWLAGCANDSPLFKNSQIFAAHLPLDTKTLWFPKSKSACRTEFHLPQDKYLILAGAVGGINQFFKGGDLLHSSLGLLSESLRKKIELIVVGDASNSNYGDWPIPVHNLGMIDEGQRLANLYACADLVLMPSRQEAFGQIASEAQSCGIPVVAFRIGGPIDIIEHKVTGWLANPYDLQDFAHGIEWILNHPNPSELSKASRDRAVRLFSAEIIANQYHKIYQQTLIANQ